MRFPTFVLVSKVEANQGIIDSSIHISNCFNLGFSFAINFRREWYSWHFPELVKIVNDNYTYAKLVKFIKDKSSINSESLEDITEVIGDEDKAREVIAAANASMGMRFHIEIMNFLHVSLYMVCFHVVLMLPCLACVRSVLLVDGY